MIYEVLFYVDIKDTNIIFLKSYIQGLQGLSTKGKSDAKKYANRLFETEFGSGTKVVEEGEDGSNLVRTLANIRAKELTYRSNRSYMVFSDCIYFLYLFRIYLNN